MNERAVVRIATLLFAFVSLAEGHVIPLRQQSGPFLVELGLPPGGLLAEQPSELFIRILQSPHNRGDLTSDAGPSGPGVPCSSLKAGIIMASMPSMPAIVPIVRSLGYPGSFAFKTSFPHGGSYEVTLNVSPSSPDANRLRVTFQVEVQEGPALTIVRRPFVLKVTAGQTHLTAGLPVTLVLSIWSRDTNRQVTGFQFVHEKPLHLILVREDLGMFFHEHPTLRMDASFELRFVFPTSGVWSLFADMAPEGAGSHVALAKLAVDGPRFRPVTLPGTDGTTATANGIVMRMQPAVLTAHKTNPLVFALSDSKGRALSGLEPWLGAPAHLIMVEQDASTFVHSHMSQLAQEVNRRGLLTFETSFPRAGFYKGWVQFRRLGKICTLSFSVRVFDPPL